MAGCMTDDEVIVSWRQARYPNEQIMILAELNCTTPKRICEILMEHGVPSDKLPTTFHRMPGRKRKKWGVSEMFLLKEMSARGMTNNSMGQEFGVSGRTIRDIIARAKKEGTW